MHLGDKALAFDSTLEGGTAAFFYVHTPRTSSPCRVN